MAVLDFPNNPQPSEVYVFEAITYTWEAPRWTAINAVEGPAGPPGPVETDESFYGSGGPPD